MGSGSWKGEALEGLVADAEGGAAFGVHFYEAAAGLGVGREGRRDWNFVDGFVGADGEALERKVEELCICGELSWNCYRYVSMLVESISPSRKKLEIKRGEKGSGRRIPLR